MAHDDMHAHYMGSIDMGEVVRGFVGRERTRSSPGLKRMLELVDAVLVREYESLAERARANDAVLRMVNDGPTLETAAESYALHALAGRHADLLSETLGGRDSLDEDGEIARDSMRTEYKALALEHQAQGERWAHVMASLARDINRAEREKEPQPA